MNGLKRFLKSVIVLSLFGATAVTLAFFIVSQTDELADDRMRMSSEAPPPPEPFGPRYTRWVRTVIGSGLTDFGQSHTGPVKNILMDRLPVTASIGLLSWVFAWGLGLALAVLLATHWRAYAALHQDRIYPIAHAVPSLVVVILFYLILVQFDPSPSRLVRTGVGILSLVTLMLPATTALWLNGILRIRDREYVRVARSRGVSPFTLWRRHILPNVIVSSGVLTQAVRRGCVPARRRGRGIYRRGHPRPGGTRGVCHPGVFPGDGGRRAARGGRGHLSRPRRGGAP